MPRGRGSTAKGRATSRPRGGSQRGQSTIRARRNVAVPDVYEGLLAEVAASTASEDTDTSRPLKKRKLAGRRPAAQAQPIQDDAELKLLPRPALDNANPSEHEESDQFEDVLEKRPLQTITDDSEESEESEEEWEDALGQDGGMNPGTLLAEPDTSVLSIDLDKKPVIEAPKARRKAATGAEKERRLQIHKTHLLYLLYHVHLRNHWCNDTKVQGSLKRLVDPKIIPFLLPRSTLSQFERNRSFLRGLDQVGQLWKSKYTITATGLRRPHWAETAAELEQFKLPENVDPPMDLPDFRKAAKDLDGSDDLGAQLFCALLRSVGVEARLVCSLQPLPFAANAQAPAPKQITPVKKTVYANHSADEYDSAKESAKEDTTSRASIAARAAGSTTTPTPIRRIQRLGQRGHGAAIEADLAPVVDSSAKPKRTYKPQYPVYWVEAFNTAYQNWVTVDPLATGSVGQPSKLEPPMSYSENAMSYVVAFEPDGVAKDVTRRYAKAYNAKTRKLRVESTEGGERWWRKAMKVFRRATVLDRDQVEDAELAKKEAAEGLPRNVQDFKDHPVYVLERHLKRNQAIYPKRESGKVNVGSASAARIEPVYRRRDVHLVRSADKWYRFGREVKPNEVPLKFAKPRRTRERSMADADEDDSLDTPLYAFFQTEPYIPPPVVAGRIPKNAFGNLDIYVPSMVPAGGVRIRAPDTAKAARLLGIDYADAVTGFQFRGRHGTAIIEGAVVAAEFAEAVRAVVEGFADARQEEEDRKRSLRALAMWKRFLVGLRIVEHVRQYETEEEKVERRIREAMEEAEREEEVVEEAGGFFPDAMQRDAAEPTGRRVGRGLQGGDVYGGGFMPDEEVEENTGVDADHGGGGSMPDEAEGGGFLSEGEGAIADGGGFIFDDSGGGGFLPQEDTVIDSGGLTTAARAEKEDFLAGASRRRRRRLRLSSSDDNEEGEGFMPQEETVAEGGGSMEAGEAGTAEPSEEAEDDGVLPDAGRRRRRRVQLSSSDEDDEPDVEAVMSGALPANGFGKEDSGTNDQRALESEARGFTSEHSTEDIGAVGHLATEMSDDEDDQYDDDADSATQEAIARSLEDTHAVTNNDKISDPAKDSKDDIEPADNSEHGMVTSNTAPETMTHQAVRVEVASSDDERGSLLSHDPEDEDAEPEWLMSD